MFLVAETSVSLKAPHRSNAHPRNQEWIFPVCLLDTSPARVTGYVDDRRQRLVCASGARLQRSHGEERLYKFGIKSCTERNWLGEAGSVDSRMSVQAFLMEYHRNSQPGVLHKELLEGICGFRHLACIQTLARITRASDLTKTVARFERLSGFR